MFWGIFESAIKRGAERGAKDFIESDRFKDLVRTRAREVVRAELAKVPHWRFLKQIQWKLHDADPSIPDAESFRRAKSILVNYLKDEGIEYGDPRFGWADEDAHEIAQSYEIEHWEHRA